VIPKATRNDAQSDLLWNEAQPVPGIPCPECLTAMERCDRSAAKRGLRTRHHVLGDARLYLDDVLIAGEEKPRSKWEVISRSAEVKLLAGQPYRVRVQYNQGKNNPTGRIQFGWRAPGAWKTRSPWRERPIILFSCLASRLALEGEEMKVSATGFSHGDKVTLQLPEIQRQLLDKVAALGKPFVVVLTSGSPVSLDIGKPNAILEAWYYGQRGGDAVAEALLGEYNPGGRLPITFYQSENDLPPSPITR